jgi:hypothetical protein
MVIVGLTGFFLLLMIAGAILDSKNVTQMKELHEENERKLA